MSHEFQGDPRFELIRPLGEGAAGSVVLVRDRSQGRTVALKLLKAEEHHPEGIFRFKQEFYLLRRLRHPHLLEVYDYGVADDGRHFFTMEPLADPLGPCPSDELANLLGQIARALGFLHERGFVHGDVTLANLRRRADGTVALIDFGLMVPVGFAARMPRGTPAYMAPEAVMGGRLDGRTDLYSLGAVAYQLATGRLPFDEAHGLAQLKAQLEKSAEAPSRYAPGLSEAIDGVITRLLSKDPVARFQSAWDLLAALGYERDTEAAFVPMASQFAGRHAELADLESLLERASAGQGGMRPYFGPPGTGKSRLLEEFGMRAQLEGACVLRGACPEQAIPYAPFLAPLRALVAQLPAERLSAVRSALGGLLGELHAQADLSLDPQKEVVRLHAAILDVFAAASAHSPVVLLLDDWQWADASSQKLLSDIRRISETHGIVVATASREVTPDCHSLEALNQAEVAEMVGSMLGDAQPDEHFIVRLSSLTNGRAGAVEAAIRSLTESGALKRRAGRWLYDTSALEGLDLGDAAAAHMQGRLAALPGAARKAAQVAALIGRPFPASLMLRPLGLSDEAGLEALDTLESQKILGRQGDDYWFVDPSWPGWLREHAPDTEAKALHTELSRILAEDEAVEERLERLNELARHALSGERPEDGIDWALGAARKNMALYAVEATRRLLERALPHARLAEQRRWIHLLLGDAERYASNPGRALSHYEAAIATGVDDATAGRLLTNCGLCAMIDSDYAAAIARFELASLRLDGRDEREWLRCATYQARAHYFQGEIPEAIACCRTALQRARAFGDPRSLCACLGLLGMLMAVGEHRHEEGIGLLLEALELAESLGDLIEQGETYSLLGVSRLATGDLSGARASFERNRELARRTHTPNDVVVAEINLALAAHELGAFGTMASMAAQALRGSEAIASDLYAGISLVLCATAHAAQGGLDEAQALLKEVESRLEAQPHDYLRLMAASYGSDIALACGELNRARDLAVEAIALGLEQGNPEFEGRSRMAAADAMIRLGEGRAAIDVLQPLRASSSRLDRAKAKSLLALAAWRSEAAEEAAEVAQQALETLESLEAAPWVARTRILLGTIALANRDRAGAQPLLEAALATANACESPQLICHALFALAASKPEERYVMLRRANDVLNALKQRMRAERFEEMLALDELWSVSQGDFQAFERPSGLASEEPQVSEKRFQAALMREQRLLAEIETLKADKRRSDIMMRFLSETSGECDYQEALRRTIASVASLLEADDGLLLLPDAEGRLEVYSVYNVDAANVMGFSRTIAESCFHSGATVFVSDTEASPHFAALQSVIDLRIQSALAVPLRSGDTIAGVIYIHRHTIFNGFTPEDRTMAETFARHAAKTLTQTRLLAESTAMTRRVSMLHQLSRSLSQSLELATVLDRAVLAALDFTSAGRALLLLSEDGVLSCRQAIDRYGPLEPQSLCFPAVVCQEVFERGLPISRLVADDPGNDPFAFSGMNLRTVLCAPLVVGERTLGVLYVDSQDVVTSWVETHLEMLEAIASLAAIAVSNALRFEAR